MANFLKGTSTHAFKTLTLSCFHRSLSTQTALKEQGSISSSESFQEKTEKALKESIKLSSLNKKKVVKKPQKPAFMKNLFLGKFDTDILTYPEVLDNEDKGKLDQVADSLQTFYDNQKETDSKEFAQRAKELNLFGLQVSQFSGGRECNITETCRINEIITQRHSDTTMFTTEQLGVQILLKCGNERLINKYLSDVINGKCCIAFCLAEEVGFDINAIETVASLSADKKQWVLNGKKQLVLNGSNADLFIVFARTKQIEKIGLGENNLSVFLVEKTFGGVSSQRVQTVGLKETHIANVQFENTHIPAENLIGEENQGNLALSKVLPQYRLMCGVACSEINKKLLNQLIKHCLKVSNKKNNMLEHEFVQRKLSDISLSTYALESINYLTAALIDQYEDQDCDVETMIAKAFGAESAFENSLSAMQFLGMHTFLEDNWCNVLNRDAQSYALMPESIETLKIVIALQGLQHAGVALQEDVKKARNPLYYPANILKRIWRDKWNRMDNPMLQQHLFHYLHPSAAQSAKLLEYSVSRLQYATEIMLGYYGSEVVNQFSELKRLGECAIDIYAMVAVLGRASRSYCIGLRHCDNELRLAMVFCHFAMNRVKHRVLDIEKGSFANQNELHKKLGVKLTETGKYFAEHPLNKNY